MKRIEKKKCCHCRRLFVPDPRNQTRQNYCSRLSCRKASQIASQKRWLNKPENRDYFKGPENVERVKEWRKGNPGYWKRHRSRTALQDDIANTLLAMQQFGQDILRVTFRLCLQPQKQGGTSDFKSPVLKHRIRKVPKSFSWVDHRLVRDRHF